MKSENIDVLKALLEGKTAHDEVEDAYFEMRNGIIYTCDEEEPNMHPCDISLNDWLNAVREWDVRDIKKMRDDFIKMLLGIDEAYKPDYERDPIATVSFDEAKRHILKGGMAKGECHRFPYYINKDGALVWKNPDGEELRADWDELEDDTEGLEWYLYPLEEY